MEENTFVQQDDEFTFKKLFELIRQSGKRILVYAIVAAIIGACLAAVVGVFTIDDKTYSSTIEYTNKGIENGYGPDGKTINYNMIKSAVVINAALKKMGYSEERIATLSPLVEDALSVAPYISSATAEKLASDPSYEYIPTRYSVSIQNKSVAGIKASKYEELLNSIVDAYREYFRNAYEYDVSVVDSIKQSSLDTAVDYYDLADQYSTVITSLESNISVLPDAYSNIIERCTGELAIIENELASLTNYIIINNVQKDSAVLGLKERLQQIKDECEIKSKTYSEQLATFAEMIDNYNQKFDSVIMGSTSDKIIIVGSDTTVYNNLITKIETLSNQKAQCDITAKLLEQKITNIGTTQCTDAHKQYVNQSFAELYNNYVAAIESINAEIADYTDVYVINNGVKVVNPAHTTVSIGWAAVAATVIVTVVAGIVVAVIVTSVKGRKTKNQQ